LAHRSPKRTFSLLALGLAVFVAVFLWLFSNWSLIWIWLFAINLITLVAYGYDKNQAQSGGLRIPEVVLHGLALAGGFLGGWVGRSLFHHKTRKPVFAVVLTISTIIWLVVLYIAFWQ